MFDVVSRLPAGVSQRLIMLGAKRRRRCATSNPI